MFPPSFFSPVSEFRIFGGEIRGIRSIYRGCVYREENPFLSEKEYLTKASFIRFHDDDVVAVLRAGLREI